MFYLSSSLYFYKIPSVPLTLSLSNSLNFQSFFATFFPLYALWGIKFVDEEKDRVYSVTLQVNLSLKIFKRIGISDEN